MSIKLLYEKFINKNIHSPGEGAHPPGSTLTSFQRELRLHAPPGAGCPATGSVPSYLGGPAPHLGES